MSRKKFEFVLSASTRGWNHINTARQGLRAFNKEVGNGNRLMASAKGHVAGLVGAYLGFNALSNTAVIIRDAGTAVFGLESSLSAANREFDDLGSMESWGATIERLSEKLRIYSKTDLRGAAARTIDMTKRLGLSADQMETVIARTADLSAGKTALVDGIERVTAALRGEAEASEYLGLTLNENYVKSWYEASGATRGAWKDLSDLQKAQVRYMVFLEQASPQMGKAAKSVTTFAGAYELVKARINDAITENKEMAEVMKDLAGYLEANSDELGDMAASIARAAGETAKWVLENKDLIALLGKWAIGIYLVTKAGGTLLKIFNGLKAASVAMSGTTIITWLVQLRGATFAAAAGASAMAVAFRASLLAYAAYAAYNLGAKIAEWEYLNDVVGANKEALAEIPAKFAAISEATGQNIQSFEDLDKAQKAGLIRFDKTVGEWVSGAGEMSKAVSSSAEKQKSVTGSALAAMKEKYKQYAATVKRLQGEIAGKEKDLASQLREMARSGMSDLSAWRDRKKEAGELKAISEAALKAAEDALNAGDEATAATKFKEASEAAADSKQLYAELNTAVEENGKTIIGQKTALKTAMEGVKAAGELEIAILNRQKQAAAEAGKSLDALSGGKLSEELPEVAKAFGELIGHAEDLAAKSNDFNERWNSAWKDFQSDGNHSITELQKRLEVLTKDRHIRVYVKEIAQKATGGQVGVPGFALGGSVLDVFKRLSSPYITRGSGLRDDVPAMLKRREFVQPDTAVSKYGLRFMELVRRGLFPVELARGFSHGGTPAAPAGADLLGAVSSPAGGSAPVFNLNVSFAGQVSSPSRQSGREQARMIMTELQKLYRESSR